jgi:hypothetical protein
VASVVTSQLLHNGPRRVVYKFTLFGDTDETAVTKVDATATGPLGVVVQGQTFYPGTNLKIVDLVYDVHNLILRIQWDATADLDAFICSGAGAGPFWFLDDRAGFQGLVNPMTAGATGSINFTTVGAGAGAEMSSYTVLMYLTKGIPQT